MAELYERLGNIAALLFQYETASYCFDKSCCYAKKSKVRKKYLMCLRFMMTKEQYLEWVSTKKEYFEWSADVMREYDRAKQAVAEQMQEKDSAAELNQMKEEFRRMVLE